MQDVRPEKIDIGAISLRVPAFFPSVSTIKTALQPLDYISLLQSLRDLNKQFLVSAFDVYHSRNRENLLVLLSSAMKSGLTILMDSGNYESYWRGEKGSWKQSDFHQMLKEVPSSFAFAFDEQYPPVDGNAHIKLVIDRWRRDQAAGGERVIVPIVHGNPEELPVLCSEIVRIAKVPMIAVPERRLGDGVFNRTRSILAIRKALNENDSYTGLHLLGTGNPISIALYSWAGADSFDGLEWCQTVVDHDSGLLFHLSQSDFFAGQTAWGDARISFHPRTLAHNLVFFADWMRRLRDATLRDELVQFCQLNFPQRTFRRCAEELAWECVS